MEPLAIVPDFDELKDSRARLSAGSELVSDTFGLEGGKEALDHRIIIGLPTRLILRWAPAEQAVASS
jgi:hypothetical protein